MNQCNGMRCDGFKCQRKCNDTFCWQHNKKSAVVNRSPVINKKSPVVNRSPVINKPSPRIVRKSPKKAINVLIYTIPTCPYCIKAKQLLTSKNIPYIEVNLQNEPVLRNKLIEKTGQKTVPQIFINDQFIGGYNELSKII
jgi:glutaredoxin 3